MKLIKFELFENNANQTKGNTQGMGSVQSPQPKGQDEIVSELPSKKRIPEPKEETPEKTNESVLSFNDFHLNEDGGVATATLGNTGGMGAVVVPTIGGDGATGSNFNYNGDGNPTDTGTKGSGDLPAYDTGKKFDTNPFKKKKKKKKTTKESRHFGTETPKEDMYVTSWSDWMTTNENNSSNEYDVNDIVTVDPSITTDPYNKKGETGTVVYISKKGDCVVEFNDSTIGVYSADTLILKWQMPK